ncbi:MAG: (Fe-S)-binding protein [Bacteroidota bacterium]|jgi:L-lactate dehydrogenase complex protein LldE
MIVDIFIPCYIDQFYPKVAEATIRILEKVGCGVNYNPEQTCCGQPAFNAGHNEACKEVGEKFIKDFATDNYIVVPSASCVGMIKNYYPSFFTNTLLHHEYNKLRKNIFELSDFLVNVLHITDLGSRLEGKAVFHESCAANREIKKLNEMKLLLKSVRGLELLEVNNREDCCGFGGTFSIKNPAIASGMAQDKMKDVMLSGAEYVISSDSSCLMHLESFAKKQKQKINFLHLAEVLASGI